jgi:membrane-bound lytic murein transglycosylase D
MKRYWPVCALLIYCCVCVLPGFGQSDPLAMAVASGPVAAAASNPDNNENSTTPGDMQELMKSARLRYLEGSRLIRQGESQRARAEFNKAVDLLLQSQWNVTENKDLGFFFQDLINKIRQEESRYLQPEAETEEKPEDAVVDELPNLDLIPVKVDASLLDIVEADLANTKYDIPITLNEQVLKSLDFWLGRGRKLFADGLVRSGRFKEMIQKTFREEGIPGDVMYLAQVESLFKTNAYSRAKCKGIWQFGKGTAVRYGLKVNSYVDERSDPEKSTKAAARYLNDLYGMFKDWNLVLAAYNWGEGKVLKLIEKSGLNDFWDMLELRRNFPKETKNHVPLIQASVILAHNPEKYGFPRELDIAEAFDAVTIDHSVDLKAAAKILNTSDDELKRLNPALRWTATPANYPDFQLRIPVGSNPEMLQQIAGLPTVKAKPPSSDSPIRYKVKAGDTLASIAGKHKIAVKTLQEANGLSGAKALKVGSFLRIPVSQSRTASASTRKPPAAGSKTASARKSPAKPAASASASKAAAGKKTAASASSSPGRQPKLAPSKPKVSSALLKKTTKPSS